MKYFQRLIESKLPMTWTVILVGWRGIGNFGKLCDLSDVKDYAYKCLEALKANEDLLINLIISDNNSEGEVDSTLVALSSADDEEYRYGQSVWVVLLLEDVVEGLPTEDPLNGMIALTEFWASLDYPNYMPHQVQGVNNGITPENYYTSSNYAREIGLHKQWIQQRRRILTGDANTNT